MTQSKRSNVLFFFTDDQRFDTIGGMGCDFIHTPNIDRLVERGTTFSQAYIMGGSCPAVCMPSRAMLMTGRTLYHLENQGQSIPEAHTMMGEAFRQAGYTTFGTGKWHNGTASYARSFTAGGEIFFGGMDDHWNVPACDFDPTGAYDNARPFVRTPHTSNAVSYRHCDHIELGKHSSELFAEAAIQFLETYKDEAPFFMYLSFMAPHDPRTMPREFLEMYDTEEIDLPPNYRPEHPFDNGELRVRDELLAAFPRTPEEIRRHNAEYYAMISHLDAQIGRVLDSLEARGLAEETVIVLAGDNGLAIGRHGLMGKQNLYDHSVHVPLIFSGPGVPAGETRNDLCYLIDIYPTLCDLTGLQTPETVEGQSLAPTMKDPAAGGRETLTFAYRGYQRAVRDARYKLIEYAVKGEGRTQLFDLQEDPWEIENLADHPAYTGIRERLRTALAHWRSAWDDDQPGQGADFWSGP